jgi:glycosyltransferase involved in cell wall biosynthesis
VLPERKEEKGERPFRVGYIGGISWQKGVHLLLEAFQQLTNSELWIAGDTNFDPQYTARLHELATAQVHFRGKLDRAAIWKMLRQLDVLVVPSVWYETFGFVISEAFVAGVPVIAFDLGVMSERIQHGHNGLLLPLGDTQALAQALRDLQQNPTVLAQLRQGIRPVTTMGEHAGEIESLYRTL